MSSTPQSNVTPFVPAAKPGPYIADRSKFRNGGTLVVDTANLAINANLVSTDSLKVYGVPGSTNPAIAAVSIAAPLIYTPYLDAANVQQYRVASTVANDQIQLIANTLISAPLTVGHAPFNWKPPPMSYITTGSVTLNHNTFAQAYPLHAGQVRGFAKLFVPQPPLATQGSILSLNGGKVSGTSILYH